MPLPRKLAHGTAAIAINDVFVQRVPNAEAHRYAAATHALDLVVHRNRTRHGESLSETCFDAVHDHKDVFVPFDIKVRNPE